MIHNKIFFKFRFTKNNNHFEYKETNEKKEIEIKRIMHKKKKKKNSNLMANNEKIFIRFIRVTAKIDT